MKHMTLSEIADACCGIYCGRPVFLPGSIIRKGRMGEDKEGMVRWRKIHFFLAEPSWENTLPA